MKLKKLVQLEQFLDKSLAWRKKELTALKFALDTAPPEEQRVLLRAGTALLYAHWEGFVKDAGTAYVQYVALQGLSANELAENFVALGFAGVIADCGRSKKVSTHTALVRRLKSAEPGAVKIHWRQAIRTHSNLKAGVLREITETLGFAFDPYELKAKPVIDVLVRKRNNVAHGVGMQIDASEYDTLHSQVIVLLNEFKGQVEDAAAAKRFRVD